MTITLEVSPGMDAEIDNLCEAHGVSKGKLIFKALQLLKIATDARAEGKRVMIIDDRENWEQELEF